MFARQSRFVWFLLLFAVSAPALAVPVLVDGRWLESRLDDVRIVIVDMSDDDGQYQRFHIPHAVRLSYQALLKQHVLGDPRKEDSPHYPVRLDDKELAGLLGRLGITREKYVVAYDDVGGLNAARLFWELERIGHPRVSVLDGGLVRWILDGRKVVNDARKRKPAAYALEAGGRANEASLDDVRAARDKRGALLLDVRSKEEYRGERKDPRSGHIPGAHWWEWDQAVAIDGGFTRREEAALRRLLRNAGLADTRRSVITYCQSGRRAAHTYLTLRSLGFEDVRVYAASMNEYGLLKTEPVKQGK